MNAVDKMLAPHADAMRLRSQRTRLLASNIANADTPNYKARDMAFASAMQQAGAQLKTRRSGGAGLATSHSRHIPTDASASAGRARVMYRVPEQASLDGNTVDKDMEQSRFSENALRYQVSMNFFGSRVKSLIRTLRGE